jgi:hypothetical protein
MPIYSARIAGENLDVYAYNIKKRKNSQKLVKIKNKIRKLGKN